MAFAKSLISKKLAVTAAAVAIEAATDSTT